MKTSLLARAFAFAVASSLFAACGGGGGGSTTSAIPQTPTGGGQNTVPGSLQDFSWGAPLLQNAHQVGPAQFGTLSLDVMVNPQNIQGLLQYAQEVSNPGSGVYRHFLTPQQIGQQFGATQTDINSAEAYFQKYNLAVGTWPQHLLMVVTGKQADLEAAFGTKFGIFQGQGGNEFIAPATAPHFSQTVPIAAVSGLVQEHLARTFFLRPGNGSYFGEHPTQIARAFDYTGAYSKGFTGTGINIGIIGTGGISQADYAAFATATGSKMAPITLVPAVAQTPSAQNNNTGTGAFDIPTGLATPPPVTGPCTGGSATLPIAGSCNPEDGEAQLDTEQAASLAPGANVLFYLAYNTADCVNNPFCGGATGYQGLYITDDEIQQAIADNTADVITMSYGLGEPEGIGYYYDATGVGIGPAEFAALATEGIAAFASSGDNGAYNCATQNAQGQNVPTAQQCANYPATDPSVLGIGGVNYPMDPAGNLVAGQQITAWASNTTASGDGFFDNSAGSGGGPSSVFTAPPWQAAIAAITAMTGGMRGSPDISMLADPNTGPFLLMNAGFADQGQGASGGTSAASPEFAAAWALVLQACKQNAACAAGGTGPHPYRLGNPAGLLYKIYAANGSYAAPSAFYDITAGSNSVNNQGTIQAGFNAGPGYDLVTGVGVPFVGYLINQALTAAGGTSPGAP